jgi:hypothetical protein
MKKTLIAFAAVATLAVGMAATVSTAEAKIHLHGNINIGLPGIGYGPGYYDSGYGFYDTGFYDDSADCGYVKVKKVMWIDGHKYVTWKKKLVCE